MSVRVAEIRRNAGQVKFASSRTEQSLRANRDRLKYGELVTPPPLYYIVVDPLAFAIG